MAFCKWCLRYAHGALIRFEFVCHTCFAEVSDYYTAQEQEQAWR